MVGCKCENSLKGHRMSPELIDTWWDVNEGGMLKKIFWTLELIDTWWDVNLPKFSKNCIVTQELIDTWWDVNMRSAE